MKVDVLNKLLNRVYLGGAIEECVLSSVPKKKKNISSIRAVDLSNSIVAFVEGDVGLEGISKDLGIGNISLVLKFLDWIKDEDVEVSLDKNRLVFDRGGVNQLEFLTADPEVIPTAIDEGGQKKLGELFDSGTVKIGLDQGNVKDILGYLSLLEVGSVTFEVSTSKETIVKGGLDSEHKFKISIGKPEEPEKKDSPFVVSVHRKLLVSILQVLEFGEDVSPMITFAPEMPVVIRQDGNNAWLLSPITK